MIPLDRRADGMNSPGFHVRRDTKAWRGREHRERTNTIRTQKFPNIFPCQLDPSPRALGIPWFLGPARGWALAEAAPSFTDVWVELNPLETPPTAYVAARM